MTGEASELLSKGQAAFRAGKLEQAETLLQQAIVQQPRAAVAHALLSTIARKRGDLPAAERLARRAIEVNPMEPGAHDALIAVQELARGTGVLLDMCRRAAAEQPDDFRAVYQLGTLLFMTGNAPESVEWLYRALELSPNTYPVEMKLAWALFGCGKYGKVLSVIRHIRRRGEDAAAVHELAGRVLLQLKQPDDAVVAYRRALERDGDEYKYHVGLSAALYHAGQMRDAQEVTRDFLKRFNAHSLVAKAPEARVLVISDLGLADCYTWHKADRKFMFVGGNSLTQVRGDRITYHFTCIQHPDFPAAVRALGPIDIIFNNLGSAEASIKGGQTRKLREVVDALELPVINAPEAMEHTTRATNAKIITEKTDIIYPVTILFHLAAEGPEKVRSRILDEVCFPMLIRRSHTNMDLDVRFVANKTELAETLEYYQAKDVEDIYAIEFVTEEFRPGIYRKIRCAIIDNTVYPVRVDFSTHWNVRRKAEDSALSLANPDLMDDEHAFLRDPTAYLGEKNMVRLEALGWLHGLDFLGVDFNILGDGDMVIFEANPSMNCIERRRVEEFPYFGDYWEGVLVAFEDMIVKKAGKR